MPVASATAISQLTVTGEGKSQSCGEERAQNR